MTSQIGENQCRQILSYLVLGLEKGVADYTLPEKRLLFELNFNGTDGPISLAQAEREFLEAMLRKAHEGLRTLEELDPQKVDSFFQPFRAQLNEGQPATLHCPEQWEWGEGKKRLLSPKPNVADEAIDRHLKSLGLELPKELKAGGKIQNPRALVILMADYHTSIEEQKRYLNIVDALLQTYQKSKKLKLIRADEGIQTNLEEQEAYNNQLKEIITQKYSPLTPMPPLAELFDLFLQDEDIHRVVETVVQTMLQGTLVATYQQQVSAAISSVLDFALNRFPHETVIEDPTDFSALKGGFNVPLLIMERSRRAMEKIDARLKENLQEDKESVFVVFRHVGGAHLSLEMKIMDQSEWSYVAFASTEVLRALQRLHGDQ